MKTVAFRVVLDMLVLLAGASLICDVLGPEVAAGVSLLALYVRLGFPSRFPDRRGELRTRHTDPPSSSALT